MTSEPIEYSLVDDESTLEDLLQAIARAELIALDTEFVRERTFYPELCVLQIATDEVVAAVDCLAEMDLAPLFDVLLAPNCTWLLHSARQDLEVLFNRAQALPGKLIDTQIAAALIGFPLQIGLQGLLERTLGVVIGKEHTRTDWGRRPLPGPALGYALDDVRHLLPAWRHLDSRLHAEGRIAWFEEDCARQLNLPIQPEAATILERTKGQGALRGDRRGAALSLIRWRESKARQRNRPRRWILTDEQLVGIAAALPATTADLERVPGLPPKLLARFGPELVSAILEADPVPESPEPIAADKRLIKRLQSEVRLRAEKLGIQPEMLATRRDIGLAAAGRFPEAFTNGWRGSILGDLTNSLSQHRA